MDISKMTQGDVSILDLSGPLTVGAGVHSLRRAMAETTADRDRRLILDFSRVSYLDAAGIGELVRCHRQALRSGTRLVLVGLRGKVEEILGLTALLGQVERAGSREEALQRLRRLRLTWQAPTPVRAG